MDWRRKDAWSKRGDGFAVEIVHWLIDFEVPLCGPHRWNVYAYIYPTHPHHKFFAGDDMFQDAAAVLPLHGGPTLLRREIPMDTVRVGSDYTHYRDDHFTHMATLEEAGEVVRDAEGLFRWLSEYKRPEAAAPPVT